MENTDPLLRYSNLDGQPLRKVTVDQYAVEVPKKWPPKQSIERMTSFDVEPVKINDAMGSANSSGKPGKRGG
ncbi:hypothetical protein DSCW_06900 [Desulfosarcina widdelii]|uniref:Uncharacterized protein n=1 Tax=Desulfosarcina widdelii TaxID=947919 RepID=A0A5K7YZC2_9BACT|nr:hypothetical protein DSCW_06900 [Desulfosarcina widdelii]